MAGIQRELQAGLREAVGLRVSVRWRSAPATASRCATRSLDHDEGIILDDGTVSRLSESHYFLTTTTGNVDFVEAWLNWWLAGAGLCAPVTNVTADYAAVNVAGPRARDTLRKLTDTDFAPEKFQYMMCRQANMAGVPAILLRIGLEQRRRDYFNPGSAVSDGNQWNARIDHQFSNKDNFFARYTDADNPSRRIGIPTLPTVNYNRFTNAAVSETHILSANFLLTTRNTSFPGFLTHTRPGEAIASISAAV